MARIKELARTVETSFTDCGVFAFNARAVMDGAIVNVAFAVKEPHDRPWRRLHYYHIVDAHIRSLQHKHSGMWPQAENMVVCECTDTKADAATLTLASRTSSASSKKSSQAANPLTAEAAHDLDYDQYAHVFTATERKHLQALHRCAVAYAHARQSAKRAQDAYTKAAKKHKDKAAPLKRAVDAKEALLAAVRTILHEKMDAVLPDLFEAFRARFFEAVNELRVCFRLSPEVAGQLRGQSESQKQSEARSVETPPEQTAAAPLHGIEDMSGEVDQPSPTPGGAVTSRVLHGEEKEKSDQPMSVDCEGEVWFRFFYFDRLKSSTEKLSLNLTLCLLHFIRLEKKYNYEYPAALKAKMHHMLDVLNGYSWEKHRKRFDCILRDMFHYRKNLEHLCWATQELHELERKIEKHSGGFLKRKVSTYMERRVQVQTDIDALRSTLFESGANEMLKFYDALLTVVIESLNDLVHLLHGSSHIS